MSGLSPDRLAEIEARDALNPVGPVIYNSYGQIVWGAQDRRVLLAEIKRLRALVVDAWDDGNAVGLDGWVGPERGTEPVDDEAIRKRERFIRRARAVES